MTMQSYNWSILNYALYLVLFQSCNSIKPKNKIKGLISHYKTSEITRLKKHIDVDHYIIFNKIESNVNLQVKSYCFKKHCNLRQQFSLVHSPTIKKDYLIKLSVKSPSFSPLIPCAFTLYPSFKWLYRLSATCQINLQTAQCAAD